MIVAAAFCPSPPILHPLALGSAGESLGSPLRTACALAVDRALSAGPDAVLVLGPGSGPAVFGPGDVGDLSGFGVPVRHGFDGPPTADGDRIPVAHTLGAWLLDEAGFTGKRLGLLTGSPAPDWTSQRWAVLIMGDGSARRTESSPGWYDPEAISFDDQARAALAGGDPAALLDLDEAVGERVLAAGVSTWRAAGALLTGVRMSAKLHFADAPFGVYYVAASWTRQP